MEKVSIEAVIQDYYDDSGLTSNDVSDDLLTRWITDAVAMVTVAEELEYNICPLYLENYKATLPDNFRKVQQILFRKKKEKKVSGWGETVTKWTQKTFDPNFDVEIHIVCKKCGSNDCTCSTPIYEVDIDRTWEIANPQYYKRGWNRMGIIGRGKGNSGLTMENEWMLLRPKMGDDFLNKYLLDDCPNLYIEKWYNHFSIDGNSLTIDHPEGEVILFYMGVKMDDNGDIMIPNHPDLFDAITHHLDYKYFAREARKSVTSRKKNSQLFKTYSREAKIEREQAFGKYRASVTSPDFKGWSDWVERIWLQRIPNRNWDNNMKKTSNVGIYERYSNIIEGGGSNKRYTY